MFCFLPTIERKLQLLSPTASPYSLTKLQYDQLSGLQYTYGIHSTSDNNFAICIFEVNKFDYFQKKFYQGIQTYSFVHALNMKYVCLTLHSDKITIMHTHNQRNIAYTNMQIILHLFLVLL